MKDNKKNNTESATESLWKTFHPTIVGQGLQDAIKDCSKRAVKDNDDLRADIQNKPFLIQR